MSTSAQPVWTRQLGQVALQGLGDEALLNEPMVAFLASRQCPGAGIRTAMDWALAQARRRQVVISGFHSPLEQSVLAVLLAARCPVVVALARPVVGARLRAEWKEALAQGRMAVIGSAQHPARLTADLADARNSLVGRLASQWVVAHASPGGRLAQLVARWRAEGRSLSMLS